MNITKTEAAKLLGVTSSRGSQLNRTHLKAFKESEQYRKKLNEIERICASDFVKNKSQSFNDSRQPIIQRSEKAFDSFRRSGLDGRFCELPNDLPKKPIFTSYKLVRTDAGVDLSMLASLDRMNEFEYLTK